MHTKRIFLASSEALRDDRIAFELMIGQLNQEWVPKGTFFNLVVWENFIDSLSKDGLQAEYNRAVRRSDVFVMLFFTKVGRFTAQEFDAAFGEFSEHQRPIIYTYFKDAVILTVDIDESVLTLLEFKKKLTSLGHYYTRYRSAEELKWLFSRQLDKLFGGLHGFSLELTDSSPQSQIDIVALAHVNRLLNELDGSTHVDLKEMDSAVRRASELTRHTIFLVAQRTRRANWANNKLLMERTIPVFEALLAVDRHKHYYFGQLGFAIKDKVAPDFVTALRHIEQAIQLVGVNDLRRWPHYIFSRVICRIGADPSFARHEPSEENIKTLIFSDIKKLR